MALYTINTNSLFVILKVKQYRNRPGVAQTVAAGLGSQIS
jgi:hypothetical protein